MGLEVECRVPRSLPSGAGPVSHRRASRRHDPDRVAYCWLATLTTRGRGFRLNTATDDLGCDFWTWRASMEPRSHDDIPRITRPAGWLPRWSSTDVERYRADVAGFEGRLRTLPETADRAEMVDRRLIGSACARVHWELDVLRMWQTQPAFYTDQTIGAVFEVLLAPEPDEPRIVRVAELLEHTATVLADARVNLTDCAVAEFGRVAIEQLADIETQVNAAMAALAGRVGTELAGRLTAAAAAAATALGEFRDWVAGSVASWRPAVPIGREVFQWFLTAVALLPLTPEEILGSGQAELDRAIALELLERNCNRFDGAGKPTPQRDPVAQSAAESVAELAVRRFYVERCILGQPDSLGHYRNLPLPDYLAPLRWLGVTDDLTSPERVNEDGVSYVPSFPGEMPYFYAANAQDPRAGIVHEGAHYQQLALSWRHPRPLRRHYYDSAVNEGIAFYNEELTLASGLFADAPRTREIMYNFMRLRALRVEVDVRLALGELDIESAGHYLRRVVPMDEQTAREEAAFFAALPGQALTYQVGKSQILRLLADCVRAEGNEFDLERFHDRLWREGNVPISLQRWELLDDDSDLRRVAELAQPLAPS
jgi:Bacterial protein of unknown function (DUF885)